MNFEKAAAALEYVSKDMIDFARKMVTQVEGTKFVNDPKDKGGATKCGISLRYAKAQGMVFDLDGDGSVDAEDIKLVTADMAVATFLYDFFVAPGLNKLPLVIQEEAFDASVNHGANGSIRLVQRTLNKLRVENSEVARAFPVLSEDGVLGAKTNTAAHIAHELVGEAHFINVFCDVRDTYYDDIVEADPAQIRFLNGWKRRSDAFRLEETA